MSRNTAGSSIKGWAWIAALPLTTAGVVLASSGQPGLIALIAVCTVLYLVFSLACVREPMLLAAGLLLMLAALPPLYLTDTDWPFYASFLLLPIAPAVFLLRSSDLRLPPDPVAKGLIAFLSATLASVPFAWWISGTEGGLASVSRWLLLGHTAVVYALIRGSGRPKATATERRMPLILLVGAVCAASYGIVDFLWPIPLSHPSAEQLIWLEGAVVRRGQGPFYESSSFASFCGFFLVVGAAALLRKRHRYLSVSRTVLSVFVCVLGLAALLAFSRSAWAAILTALLVVAVTGRISRRLSRVPGVLLALVTPLLILWAVSPELWDYLLDARLGRLSDLLVDPDTATSGRFGTWLQVLSIMRDEPQFLVFGVGYKTLSTTPVFGAGIVTDNGYLSLLLETGIVGLAGFAWLSTAILRVFFRVARSPERLPAFWAMTILAIWCGELVLLLAADAHTYWRNLTILSGLMALTLNMAERAEHGRTP
jgi:O-antigen ligase